MDNRSMTLGDRINLKKYCTANHAASEPTLQNTVKKRVSKDNIPRFLPLAHQITGVWPFPFPAFASGSRHSPLSPFHLTAFTPLHPSFFLIPTLILPILANDA
jgi:hypothetical protein